MLTTIDIFRHDTIKRIERKRTEKNPRKYKLGAENDTNQSKRQQFKIYSIAVKDQKNEESTNN